MITYYQYLDEACPNYFTCSTGGLREKVKEEYGFAFEHMDLHRIQGAWVAGAEYSVLGDRPEDVY
jgi:hypothetical protein